MCACACACYIRDVPPEGAKLLALLDDGVEEAEPEDELAPSCALRVLLEEFGGNASEGAPQIGAKTLGRLVGYFDEIGRAHV